MIVKFAITSLLYAFKQWLFIYFSATMVPFDFCEAPKTLFPLQDVLNIIRRTLCLFYYDKICIKHASDDVYMPCK